MLISETQLADRQHKKKKKSTICIRPNIVEMTKTQLSCMKYVQNIIGHLIQFLNSIVDM